MTLLIRQGDVLLKPFAGDKRNLKSVPSDGVVTVALGEVTGHHHDIVGNIEVFNSGQALIVQVNEEAMITHQEHVHLPVPVGMWEVVIQREYTMLDEVKKVID